VIAGSESVFAGSGDEDETGGVFPFHIGNRRMIFHLYFGGSMSLKKQYLKNKPICKVTFKLPRKLQDWRTVHVVGEFNGWDVYRTPMKKLKDGTFAVTLDWMRAGNISFVT
jgi:hypothetical protein